MTKDSGQILVIVIATLGVVLFTVLFIIAGAQLFFQNSSYSLQAEKASALAEAGIDKALNSLNKTGGSYNGETETILGDGSYSVILTAKDAGTNIIESTGYVPNKSNPKVKRTIKTEVSKGEGISFRYGMQVGEGGLEMAEGNTITGSVYSNGSVQILGLNNRITGDLWVAGGTQGIPDQENDCSDINCTEFIFGKNVSGEDRLDPAQSFRPSFDAYLNKIQLKLKKYGDPTNVTVRILKDHNGKPDKNGVLATGTLLSSLVSNAFDWVDVTFGSSPELDADTVYWVLIDTSSNSINYWSWQNDLAQSYMRGTPKWSPNWSTGNPLWNNYAGDFSFKLFLGDVVSAIDGGGGLIIGGEAHANTVRNTTIEKDAYYQSEQNIIVRGQNCSNNTYCHPGSGDPPPSVLPISEGNISQWKQDAQTLGGIISTTNITECRSTLGPGKITASLDYSDVNDCTVTVKTPIWITGDLIVKNGNIFNLDSSYGASSGVILVDGRIIFERNNNQFLGSGTTGSYLVLLSAFNSIENNGLNGIEIKNGGNSGVLYAPLGIVDIENGNSFKEIIAWKLKLKNNINVFYETGLANAFFTSGPGGSYSIIKGTYQAK